MKVRMSYVLPLEVEVDLDAEEVVSVLEVGDLIERDQSRAYVAVNDEGWEKRINLATEPEIYEKATAIAEGNDWPAREVA